MTAIRFDHIALGVRRLSEVTPFLVGELGGQPCLGGSGRGFRGGQWEFAGGARLEILEPAGPADGFLHRFLARRGPGIHHVTFLVPNLRQAADQACELGYSPVGYDDSQAAWKEVFLHPRQAQGILVQLAQVDLSAEGAWGPDWPAPQGSPTPPPPVGIVGLRLAARSPEAALRQWQELLDGQLVEQEGQLCFHWPESPMRLAVTIAAAAPEQALCVEVAADRPVAMPEGPHPVLGARFVPVEAALEP